MLGHAFLSSLGVFRHPLGRLSARVVLLSGFVALIPASTSSVAAQEVGAHDLGAVEFGVSCAPDVRADFDRALALLHHMMYQESRKAFEAIAAEDPDCAMAQWGIAMTLFQPLWPARPGPDQLRRGWEAVQRAKTLGPGTDRERAFVAAAEAFFREPESADWWTRIRRWAEAMEAAYRERPDDIETAAFYALSQLAVGPVTDGRMAHQARAAEVLLGIHEREPNHPGAIHYTIHANDVDGRAGRSLAIVRSYDDIAPSVAHALHMPTHIFVRLGEWPEVIEWNRKSADAALRSSAGADAISLHYVHAMDYLLYAHLQRGEDQKARAVLDEVRGKGPYQEDFASAFHLAAMPARHAVERRDWAEAAGLTSRSPASLAWDRYPWAEALTWLGRGLGAVHTGDLAAARQAESRMQGLRDRAEAQGERDFARYIEIDRLILAAWLARAEGEPERAVTLARSAGELERQVQKHPITPGALMPAYEALGDLLLELNRPADALEAYETSRDVWPRRFNTLLGAARAARGAGDTERARDYYAELVDVVGPTADRAELREAREFLAGASSGL